VLEAGGGDGGGGGAGRRIALALAAAALALGAAGAFWLTRFARQVGRDPGLVYRDPGTLEKLLKRASDAERAGDRATATSVYRFVIAVAAESSGGGRRLEVAPYVAAARAGLTRLGVFDTPPGPPR
jgi:hypothetical protein